MKINVALFGLGRIGMMHAKNIKEHHAFKLKILFMILAEKYPIKHQKNLKLRISKKPSLAFKR